jgi:hypothetical protein
MRRSILGEILVEVTGKIAYPIHYTLVERQGAKTRAKQN